MAIKRTLLPLMLLAGCAVGPDFRPPVAVTPAAWLTGHPPPTPVEHSVALAEPIDPAWWSLFNDAELTRLVNLVAEQNLDVRIATIRLAELRAQRGTVAAHCSPRWTATRRTRGKSPAPKAFSAPSAPPPVRFRVRRRRRQRRGGSGTSAGPGGTGGASIAPLDLYQVGFDASWELDLWGRVRRSVELADASIDASAEARRDTLLNSLAELVRDYVQLRGVQADIAITRDSIATGTNVTD